MKCVRRFALVFGVPESDGRICDEWPHIFCVCILPFNLSHLAVICADAQFSNFYLPIDMSDDRWTVSTIKFYSDFGIRSPDHSDNSWSTHSILWICFVRCTRKIFFFFLSASSSVRHFRFVVAFRYDCFVSNTRSLPLSHSHIITHTTFSNDNDSSHLNALNNRSISNTRNLIFFFLLKIGATREFEFCWIFVVRIFIFIEKNRNIFFLVEINSQPAVATSRVELKMKL